MRICDVSYSTVSRNRLFISISMFCYILFIDSYFLPEMKIKMCIMDNVFPNYHKIFSTTLCNFGLFNMWKLTNKSRGLLHSCLIINIITVYGPANLVKQYGPDILWLAYPIRTSTFFSFGNDSLSPTKPPQNENFSWTTWSLDLARMVCFHFPDNENFSWLTPINPDTAILAFCKLS